MAINQLNFGNQVVFFNGSAITLPVKVSDPGTASVGDIYFNSVSLTIKYYNGTTWIDLGAGGSGSQKVDKFTLNSTDISNKYVTLSSAPTTADQTLLIVGDAGGMFYGVDFTVSGNQLSWSSLALDGILAVGDNLSVTYGA